MKENTHGNEKETNEMTATLIEAHTYTWATSIPIPTKNEQKRTNIAIKKFVMNSTSASATSLQSREHTNKATLIALKYSRKKSGEKTFRLHKLSFFFLFLHWPKTKHMRIIVYTCEDRKRVSERVRAKEKIHHEKR